MDFQVTRLKKFREILPSEAGVRALVNRAPQAEAWADRSMERLRPAMMWLYTSRRRLATTMVAVLTVWLFVHVMFGANGMVVYRQKKSEYQDLRQQLDQLHEDNDSYTDRIKSLKTDPETIEKEAREQLHYTRPGEYVYVTPTSPPPARTNDRAARK